ncbi:MAG: hypothetical protein ACU84Q_16015 [Gammaproteobacteria bacterium]
MTLKWKRKNRHPAGCALLSLAIILTGGCSGGEALSVISGSSKYLAQNDVPDGDHPRQKMDV